MNWLWLILAATNLLVLIGLIIVGGQVSENADQLAQLVDEVFDIEQKLLRKDSG